jgi:hypothetical protein
LARTLVTPLPWSRAQSWVVTIIKQDIDKLLATSFIKPIEKATWLSSIVIVPKKNGKLKICVDFRKLKQLLKKTHTHYRLLMRLLTL